MYCSKCGNEIKSGEVYCPKCGAKVGSKVKFSVSVVVIAVLATILVCVIASFAYMRYRFTHHKRTDDTKIESVAEKESVVETESIVVETQPTSTVPPTTQATQPIQPIATVPPTTKVPQTTQPMTTVQPLTAGSVSFTPPIAETETTKSIETTANNVPNEFGGPGVIISPTAASSKMKEETTSPTANKEVKVKSTEKITDTLEDDDERQCKLSISKPIMQGKDDEETEWLNSAIEEIVDEILEEMETIAYDYDDIPKSIVLSSATLTSTTKSNIFINLTGTITLRTGSTKTLKYRIIYDREEGSAEVNKI